MVYIFDFCLQANRTDFQRELKWFVPAGQCSLGSAALVLAGRFLFVCRIGPIHNVKHLAFLKFCSRTEQQSLQLAWGEHENRLARSISGSGNSRTMKILSDGCQPRFSVHQCKTIKFAESNQCWGARGMGSLFLEPPGFDLLPFQSWQVWFRRFFHNFWWKIGLLI